MVAPNMTNTVATARAIGRPVYVAQAILGSTVIASRTSTPFRWSRFATIALRIVLSAHSSRPENTASAVARARIDEERKRECCLKSLAQKAKAAFGAPAPSAEARGVTGDEI